MSKRKQTPIHTIIGHTEADLDVWHPAWTSQGWGRELFPGIESIDDDHWIFLDAGTERYLGMDADELLANGYLMLDLGGGMFDHHKVGNRPAKPGECSATLMAKYLGIDELPEVQGMLNYVKQNDLSGGGMTTDLASRIKRMYATGSSELEVRDYVYAEFEADYEYQKASYAVATGEYKESGRFSWINLLGGKKLKLVVIESDNESIARVMRSKNGQHAAILIQRKRSGHVFIAANKHYNPNLQFVAGLLRCAEARTRSNIVPKNPELYLPGKFDPIPEWFYFRAGDDDVAIMNGGPKNPNVEPTLISLENIEHYVRRGIELAHDKDEVAKLKSYLQLQSAA